MDNNTIVLTAKDIETIRGRAAQKYVYGTSMSNIEIIISELAALIIQKGNTPGFMLEPPTKDYE